VIVVPEKWKKLVTKLEKELTFMSRNFELEAEEQLFLCLVGRLKESNGSIFNSGKSHQAQLREFMIKRLVQAIFQLINGKKISSSKVVNIALDINGMFFDEMKKSDADKLAKNILNYVERSNHFMQQKVIDLILSRKA
jgi:ABC-type dipeptide/oligopeptide/nickel transport system ATPase subunit